MGIDRATIQFLLNAKTVGFSLDRILTIGRQTLYCSDDDLHQLLSENGISCTRQKAAELGTQDNRFAEPLLRYLGAGETSSLDFSDYENATIIHDMNRPLDAHYHQRFSLVLDGGSLEHVFNYPTAVANCMQAVELNGHLLIITPANNLMGHGFYQFSPELLFRVLSPENGFEIKHLIVYESPWDGSWYEVEDPQKLGHRVEFFNSQPLYLIACAKRIALKTPFEQVPQQSDYSLLWKESAGGSGEGPRRRVPAWKRAIPSSLVKLYWRMRPFRPPYYRKLPPGLA